LRQVRNGASFGRILQDCAMKRGTANFIVDLISFVGLLGLAFTGFIMRNVLPPGSGGRGFRGGRGVAQEQIRELWSMSRHEWGTIHFYLALLFVLLMAVHIILHWDWIKNYFKALFGFLQKTTNGSSH
jgi:hypothetical protein